MAADDTDLEKAYELWRKEHPLEPIYKKGDLAKTPGYLLQGIKQNAPALGVLGGTGLALDVLAPEVTIPSLLLRSALMGGENVALTKGLPKEYGGSPETPAAAAFALGAIPEAAVLGGGKAASRFFENRLAKRGAGAVETALGKLDPEALAVQERLLKPRGTEPYPAGATGQGLTRQTFEAQAPVNQTIQAARTKYGAPIGEAYKTLKGDKPIDATGFAKVADDMKGELISPTTARANTLLQQFRMLDPNAQKAAHEAIGGLGQSAEDIRAALGETGPQLGAPRTFIDEARAKRELSEDLFKRRGATPAPEFKPRPATLDHLRNLRQQVNTELRTAQGGDRYLLGRLQDQLDTELMPHLPPEMDKLRKDYAGFINRWGYRDQQAFSRLKNPQEVADWVFKDPAKARDLFAEAAPPQRDELRKQFIQHVYGDLDATASESAQAKAVRAKLRPYMQDSRTAKMVMGPDAGEQMRFMTVWPKYTEDFKEQWAKNPKFREQVQRGMRDYVVNKGADPDQAAMQMIQDMSKQQPELAQLAQQMPAQIPKAQGRSPFSRMAIGRHAAMAGIYGGVALSGHAMGFGMMYQLAALAAFAGSDAAASFSTASRLGITGPMLKAFQSGNGYLVGRALGRAGLNYGAKKIQQSAGEPLELQ